MYMYKYLHVIGKVVFILYMSFKPMGHFIKVLFPNTTDETFGLKTHNNWQGLFICRQYKCNSKTRQLKMSRSMSINVMSSYILLITQTAGNSQAFILW